MIITNDILSGLYYVGSLIGPAVGFIVGGQLLNIFTEIDIE